MMKSSNLDCSSSIHSSASSILDYQSSIPTSKEIVYRQYENQEDCTQKTLARGETTRAQILSQDIIRRLLNTSESLGAGAKSTVVDDYS